MFNKVIITSGPTREWIDPVRYISNASSGKMGFYIANEVFHWIPNVVYIYGGVQEKYANFSNGKKISVETTINMRDAILNELEENTLVIMAAAPADFRPIMTANSKIKKKQSEGLMIEFEQNPDILQSVKFMIEEKGYKNTKLVGFAAETDNLEENAKGKLERKGLTYIVGNYVSRVSGFGEGNSGIRVFSKDGLVFEVTDEPKEKIAKIISNFLKEKFS